MAVLHPHLILGRRYGRLSSRFGFALDMLRAAEVVVSAGALIRTRHRRAWTDVATRHGNRLH
jgi:hypothetical protein